MSPVDSARNLGVAFDSTISFSKHIFTISEHCLNYILDPRRPIHYTTVYTIATPLVHFKLDF